MLPGLNYLVLKVYHCFLYVDQGCHTLRILILTHAILVLKNSGQLFGFNSGIFLNFPEMSVHSIFHLE